MQKIIFTEEYCKPGNLHPFTYTRHIQDIRIGILTIREKWEHYLKIASANKWEDHYLDNEQSIKIEKGIGNDDYLLVHANVLPSKAVISKISKLQNGEFLTSGKEGGMAFKFSDKEVLGLHKIKINRSVEFKGEMKTIHYPWQIVELNDWSLREDFNLITAGRKSKVISKTNRLVNPSQIFIEAGAKVEHCILNAGEGPVYIGKNAVIMEGSLLRGPVAVCEGAVVKMGTKIYGATTVGPFCTVGGEIKNSVLFGFSNKAHEGYLGDSVLGEWCNLGAGTSNSNVKNNAGEVKFWVDTDKKEMSAGSKGGLLMGDYSKAAINTSFNTGTVVGICCNVFATGLTPKLISNFSWGVDGITKYKLNKALIDIDNWKKLKGLTISEREKQILRDIYKLY
jgi:UDP-N-acetylglucosamine diphosphorylase / glucose-1-phosphate thymidylyltransferase / UDP-N-acetylgalactosamine diphosphorylase / glucosamine-1-phosphate N-acetyltransferase / galactosamine-1-phosphate N-acetyltransferase